MREANERSSNPDAARHELTDNVVHLYAVEWEISREREADREPIDNPALNRFRPQLSRVKQSG